MITRREATDRILDAKEQKGFSFNAIAESVGRDVVWTTAALLGQMKMDPSEADRVTELLGLDEETSRALQRDPAKGSLDAAVPTDPLIYRFYELVQVYGTTWKELIQEEFGDGIMSAIDFDMAIERQGDP